MRTLTFAAMTLLFWTSAASAQDAVMPTEPSQVRVGVFSPQRAFVESGDGKGAMARLSALQTEKAQEIERRNKALQSERLALEQGAAVLSESARSQRGKDLERFELDVQRFIEDAQAELMGVRSDLESAFLARLGPAIGAVAGARGLHLVLNLDADTVAWVAESLDITADVVRHLDERAPEDQ